MKYYAPFVLLLILAALAILWMLAGCSVEKRPAAPTPTWEVAILHQDGAVEMIEIKASRLYLNNGHLELADGDRYTEARFATPSYAWLYAVRSDCVVMDTVWNGEANE